MIEKTIYTGSFLCRSPGVFYKKQGKEAITMITKRIRKLSCILLALVILTAVMLTSCGNAPTVEKPKKDTVTFYGYYDAPPAVNGNVMSNSGSPSSVYFQYARLIEYSAFDEEHYHYILAQSMEQQGNDTIITLRDGLLWSDGTPLTARDVVCTYNMLYMQDYHFWQDLESCEATDDRTVVFHWHSYSEASLIRALNIQISMSEKNYGTWAAQADQFISARTWDEENLQFKDHPAATQRKAAVMQECYEWLPELENAMCSGAYVVTSVSNSEIRLTKNPNYYNAENVRVENLCILRTVSNEAYMASAMSNELDIDTCGLLPDMYAQVEEMNPNMATVYAPMLSQQVLEFNLMADYVNRSEVRQAIAYVVDRNEYLQMTEVGYEEADLYCTGLPPLWRDQAADETFLSTLTAYETDTSKAEALLQGIGWSRGADNYWCDETGKTVELEIVATNTYMSYFVCGEAVALMLDEFGLKCSFNTMELAAYNSYIDRGDHMICIDDRGSSAQIGAWECYVSLFNWSRSRIGFEKYYGSGMDEDGEIIPLKVTLRDGTEVNVTREIRLLNYGTEAEKQNSVELLMRLNNEQVYILPVATKYGPVRIMDEDLTGYPEDPMHWVYSVGDLISVAKLLANGFLYYE